MLSAGALKRRDLLGVADHRAEGPWEQLQEGREEDHLSAAHPLQDPALQGQSQGSLEAIVAEHLEEDQFVGDPPEVLEVEDLAGDHQEDPEGAHLAEDRQGDHPVGRLAGHQGDHHPAAGPQEAGLVAEALLAVALLVPGRVVDKRVSKVPGSERLRKLKSCFLLLTAHLPITL